MTKPREVVVFSVVGSRLDAPNAWRPTLVCVQRPDQLAVTRLVLLENEATRSFADAIERDAKKLVPGLAVERVELTLRDPWSFEEVYGALYELCRARTFREGDEHYVHMTTGTHVMQIVWYLLVSEHFAPAKLLQSMPGKRGEPGRVDVVDLDLSRYPALARRRHAEKLAGESLLKMGIETRSEAYNAVIASLQRAALGPAVPILLEGETGVGKSALARRVFELRKNARKLSGELVEVNCATLRGTLRESALFGHKKGAFTGAERDRRGHLAAADGGMLFLDEVGELGLEEQAMLLTALEDGRFYPVGADAPVRSQFALVCGTNRDLRAEVRAGRFRDDLLARIGVWSFRLPPLRERREDLEANVRHELEAFAERYRSSVRFSRTALAKYLAFARSEEATWAHNFRDLAQSVLRMACLAGEGLVDTYDVAVEIATLRARWAAVDKREPAVEAIAAAEGPEGGLDRVDRVQRAALLDALGRSRSLAEAGRLLYDAPRAKGVAVNYSDRVRKLCARFGVEPGSHLRG